MECVIGSGLGLGESTFPFRKFDPWNRERWKFSSSYVGVRLYVPFANRPQ